MTRVPIANLKGPRGLKGERGIPSPAGVAADEATSEFVKAGPKTLPALTENYVASPAVMGRLRAAFQSRVLQPVQMVFLGSSTVLGNGASTTGLATGGGFRMVDRVLAAAQARYPSGLGTETTSIPIANATIGRPGVHGYNGGVGGITAVALLADGKLARVAEIQPDVVWIVIGANDYSNAYAPSTYKTNVMLRLAEMREVMNKPTVFVLVHSWKREDVGSPVAPWADYGVKLREIAADHPGDVAFVDASVAFAQAGSYTSDPYALFTADLVHGNDRAHGLLADEMVRGVLPAGVRDPQLNPLVAYADFGTDAGAAPQPEKGGNWEYALGSGGLSVTADGWAYSTGAGIAAIDIGRQYSTARVVMKRPLSGTAGIGARMVDASNRLVFYIDPSLNRLVLSANIGGTNIQYGYVAETSPVGTPIELRIVATANRVDGYKNGVLVLSQDLPSDHIDALSGGTKVYLRQDTSGSSATGFRDFTVVTGSMVGIKPLAGGNTGPRALPLAGGVTGSVTWMASFDTVYVRIDVEGSFGTTDVELAAGLPVAFRPSGLSPDISHLEPSGTGLAYVSSSGSIRHARGVASTTRIRALVKFPIGM